MRWWLVAAAATIALAHPAGAQRQEKAPSGAEIVKRATAPVTFDGMTLSGPGADTLMKEMAGAQFLLVHEPHNDHITPVLTGALFKALHARYGFNYVAIEQDPFGMEAASTGTRRGNFNAIAEHARLYPYSYTFNTDEELRLIADAGRISTGGWRPVWGFDQVFGATALLEELYKLAPTQAARAEVAALLSKARQIESLRDEAGRRDQRTSHYMSAASVPNVGAFAKLHAAFSPPPGSRAHELIDALENSAQVYSYYSRANELDAAGAPLGILNNSVREERMKARFIDEYRHAEAADGSLPKVVVKAGYWHLVRGRGNSTFTLGNFLHEFAIANRSKAVAVQILALREWWPSHDKIEPEYRVLLDPAAMNSFTLVDLRPLRAHLHAGQRFGLEGASFTRFRDIVFGIDFALFAPSKPGGFAQTNVLAKAVPPPSKKRPRR